MPTSKFSYHDVILLINGMPCVQIELITLGISPRRAMEQIVDCKHDPGNGYTKTYRKGLKPQLIRSPEEVAA